MNTPDPIEALAAAPPTEPPPNPETEKIKARFVQMSTESATVKSAVSAALSEVVADWLIGQFAMAAQARLDAAANGMERWEVLRTVTLDLGRLRRCDHSAGWLALQRARFEEEMRLAAEEQRQKDRPAPGCLTQETLEKIECELNLLPSEAEFKLWKQAQEAQDAGSKLQVRDSKSPSTCNET